REPVDTGVMINPVVSKVESAHTGQCFTQRAIAEFADIPRRNDGYVGGRLLERLRMQRGGFHNGQFFEQRLLLRPGGNKWREDHQNDGELFHDGTNLNGRLIGLRILCLRTMPASASLLGRVVCASLSIWYCLCLSANSRFVGLVSS